MGISKVVGNIKCCFYEFYKLFICSKVDKIFVSFLKNQISKKMIIDTHCHLYSEEFNRDRDEMMRRGIEAGVQKFYMPAIDSESHEGMWQLEQKYPDHCFAMMGLHPCYVKENYDSELTLVEDWLSKRSFAAIGEIGLDYYWDKTFVTEQEKAFRTQIEWSLLYQKAIVIHTRNAMQETINIVKEYESKGVRGIFHCFSGSYESAKEIIKMGFYLGIGGVLTYKNAGLVEVIEKIGLQHLVLETDAPYLSPVPFRGKRNESSYLVHVIDKLTEVLKISREEIIDITTLNAQKIFGV